MRKLSYIIIFLCSALSLFSGIKPEQALWGFDGKVIENHFNIVSIMFSNPSPESFEGDIQLRKFDNLGGPIGSSQIQHLFIGPYAFRWVQFYPYVRSNSEKWVCSWGKNSKESFTLERPGKCISSVVFFTSDRAYVSRGKIRIKLFPEHLFPSSGSMTSALKAAVLDENPEFTPSQNRAFINWVKGGGKLFLLPNRDGIYPRFQGKCAQLNSPEKNFTIGNGKITKLPADIKNISLSSLGLSTAVKKKIENKNSNDEDGDIFQKRDYRYSGITDDIFRNLRLDVKTNHNWILISIVTILYLLLIVIVNFIIARKSRRALPPLIFFAVTVIVFSLLFLFIGRRGYGEKSKITSVGYAKSLGNGDFDVAQWINLFVTSGDYYTITHTGKCNYYSTCQTMEKVHGAIKNGMNGAFLVDIPLYSSRSLYHRAMMSAPQVKLKSANFTVSGNRLDTGQAVLAPEFHGKIVKAVTVFGNNIYDMNLSSTSNRHLRLNGSKTSLTQYRGNWSNSYYGFNRKQDSFEETVEKMLPGLIFRSKERVRFTIADLYILAETPDSFKAKGDKIKGEHSYTLFHFIINPQK